MNGTSLNQLYHRLNALTIFRGIAEEPVICGLEDLLFAIEQLDLDAQLGCYGAFCQAVFEEGGDLSQAICRIALEDENFYIIGCARAADGTWHRQGAGSRTDSAAGGFPADTGNAAGGNCI